VIVGSRTINMLCEFLCSWHSESQERLAAQELERLRQQKLEQVGQMMHARDQDDWLHAFDAGALTGDGMDRTVGDMLLQVGFDNLDNSELLEGTRMAQVAAAALGSEYVALFERFVECHTSLADTGNSMANILEINLKVKLLLDGFVESINAAKEAVRRSNEEEKSWEVQRSAVNSEVQAQLLSLFESIDGVYKLLPANPTPPPSHPLSPESVLVTEPLSPGWYSEAGIWQSEVGILPSEGVCSSSSVVPASSDSPLLSRSSSACSALGSSESCGEISSCGASWADSQSPQNSSADDTPVEVPMLQDLGDTALRAAMHHMTRRCGDRPINRRCHGPPTSPLTAKALQRMCASEDQQMVQMPRRVSFRRAETLDISHPMSPPLQHHCTTKPEAGSNEEDKLHATTDCTGISETCQAIGPSRSKSKPGVGSLSREACQEMRSISKPQVGTNSGTLSPKARQTMRSLSKPEVGSNNGGSVLSPEASHATQSRRKPEVGPDSGRSALSPETPQAMRAKTKPEVGSNSPSSPLSPLSPQAMRSRSKPKASSWSKTLSPEACQATQSTSKPEAHSGSSPLSPQAIRSRSKLQAGCGGSTLRPEACQATNLMASGELPSRTSSKKTPRAQLRPSSQEPSRESSQNTTCPLPPVERGASHASAGRDLGDLITLSPWNRRRSY